MTTRVSSEWTDDDSPHQPLSGAWYNTNDVVIWSFGTYLNVAHRANSRFFSQVMASIPTQGRSRQRGARAPTVEWRRNKTMRAFPG